MKTQDTAIEIKIGKLWNSGEGTTEKLHIDQSIKFENDEIVPLSNMVCDLFLIKLKNEITVVMNDFEMKISIKCERCLNEIDYDLHIKSAERQFMGRKKKDETDIHESFTIDMSKTSIDLSDMVRQEIILHFPLISLCSKGCKGLCDSCGANLNEKECNCAAEEDFTTHQPFKDLKTLFKADNKPGKPKKR